MNFEVSSCTKFQIFRGSVPDLTGGACSAPPDPIAGGRGARCPFLKNPTPALSPSGLGLLFSLCWSIRVLQKGPGKFFMAGGSWKVLHFLSGKDWEPWHEVDCFAIDPAKYVQQN